MTRKEYSPSTPPPTRGSQTGSEGQEKRPSHHGLHSCGLVYGQFLSGRTPGRYFCTTVLPARVTDVCAISLPFTEAPVWSVIDVWESTMPSMCAVVPMSTTPAACQNTFCAWAPPESTTFAAEDWVTPPAIWKIQTSLAPPLSV